MSAHRDVSAFACLHELFEAQVARAPSAPAVRCNGEQLAYAELNARANRLAHHLRALGVGPESRVAICLERSLDLVVAALAVLKAGGAYVPIDPAAPPRRIGFVLGDAAAAAIVTQDAMLGELPALAAHAVCIDRDHAEIARASCANPDSGVRAENLAYVIYTSGSTGRPKGVEIEHRQVTRLFAAARKFAAFRVDDVWALFHSFAFDASVWELFGALLHGACVVIVPHWISRSPPDFHELLRRERVTVTLQTPLALRGLIEAQAGLGPEQQQLHLRVLFCGGEALDPAWLRPWFERHGDACPLVYNLYGITEAAVISTYRRVTAGDIGIAGNGWIGRPLADTHVYLLDPSGQDVADGVVGEIHLAGPALARGYLGLPELTAQRFFTDARRGERLYRSGDLARRLPNGELEFVGRSDQQVKLRGFRIELGEIEAALCETGLVGAAVVCVMRGATNAADDQLVAYVVHDGDARPGAAVLREALSRRLPEHMIPAAFVALPAFPRNENGKIDRAALPAPDAASYASAERAEPRTAMEAALLPIWCETLNAGSLGIHDDFFALGGNSLLAVRLVGAVHGRLGKRVGLNEFLRAPTLAGMAVLIDGMDRSAADLAGLVADPARRYTPFPLTDIQRAYWVGRGGGLPLSNVATHAYAEMRVRDLDVECFERAWNRLIERHDMLRMVVTPDGEQRVLREVPYYRMQQYDLRDARTAAARAAALQPIRDALSHQLFSGHEWPLFDLRVSRLDERTSLVHISLDALSLDLASINILSRELSAYYDDPALALPQFEIGFRDYVLAARLLDESAPYRRARAYWLARLDTLPPAPDLPFAVDPAAIATPRFERRSCCLSSPRWARLKALAARHKISTNILVAGTFAEVLRRWSRNERFALNFTLFNRLPLHARVGDLVGDFTSLTLLEVDSAAPASRLIDRLLELQRQMWSDLEHRHFDGMRVQQELTRHRGRAQPYGVVVTSALGLDDAATAPRFDIYPAVVQTQTPQVWLDFLVGEANGELQCKWDSVVGLFPDGMLDAMFAEFGAVLERLAEDDGALHAPRVAQLPAAQRALIEAANATQCDLLGSLPYPARLHAPLLAQIAVQGERPAVIGATRTLSYRELGLASQRLAHALCAAGAQPERLIAIVLEKGWEQVVASVAILRAGAAYLPIDAGLPPERIAQLLEIGQVAQVVTVRDVAVRLDFAGAVLCVDERLCADGTLEFEAPRQAETDLAYVIFTSGSTGTPKGVMIEHRGALNTVLDITARYGITHADRVLGLSSLSFDLSVYDIFGILGAGGTLVLPKPDENRDPEAWLGYIERHGVTVWNTVPALLQMLVDYAPERPLPLKTVLLSGDWIPTDLPDKVRAQAPQARLYSLGGATEASIWSIDYPIGQIDAAWRSIPYGKALANQTFHVLKPDLEPAPVWAIGELYIGGIGLARGYWNDAEKTARSFITHAGRRLYRTGDLGRLLPDGNIEFLGRDDQQVKIQGYRVELGEIEARLKSHPRVRDAVVGTYAQGRAKQLVAYVVPHTSADGLADADDEQAYDGRHLLRDASARKAFVLEQRGLRRDLDACAELVLPGGKLHAQITLRGDVPVATEYSEVPLSFEEFSQTLAPLRGMRIASLPLPKFFYPSAGGLYPVQCHVSIGHDAVAGCAAGCYYYDRIGHRLLRTAEHALRAGVTLFLVADLEAIAPLYETDAETFARVEAGHMLQLLSDALPDGVAGKTVPDSPKLDAALSAAFRLGTRHRPLAAFEIAAANAAASVRTPLSAITRKSYRQFDGTPVALADLRRLAAAAARTSAQLILCVAPDGVDGLAAGSYRLDVQGRSERPIAADTHWRELFAGTAAPRHGAGFALLVVGRSDAQSDLAAGNLGQRLMQAAIELRIGLCAVGGINGDIARRELGLTHDERVVYALVGGSVSAEQIAALPVANDTSTSREPGTTSRAPALVQTITEHLAHVLPDYMVPRVIMMLRELPLSANGKLDRAALPVPAAGSADMPARALTPTERTLGELAGRLLGLGTLDPSANFFESGGNSLLAVQLLGRVRDTFGVELSIRSIFAAATLRDLARQISAAAPAARGDTIAQRIDVSSDASDEELVEL